MDAKSQSVGSEALLPCKLRRRLPGRLGLPVSVFAAGLVGAVRVDIPHEQRDQADKDEQADFVDGHFSALTMVGSVKSISSRTSNPSDTSSPSTKAPT